MSQPIFDLLKSFRGLDPLKKLLLSELQYERENQVISIRDWTDAERTPLHTPPTILAESGDFKIIYLQLRGALERSPQRVIVNRLLSSYPYALFIFSDKTQEHWHFVNVKPGPGAAKRRILRRMTVDYGKDHRTVSERLKLLDVSTLSRDMFGVAPLALQARLDEAFDVETVSRQFFQDYRRLFETVEASITVITGDQRRLFVQKLFNRLMFLMFLERKGWLTFNTRTDYVRALWNDYRTTRPSSTSAGFYTERLRPLFFRGLNRIPGTQTEDDTSRLQQLIGTVPYLNGGLFENDADDDNTAIVIPDAVFDAVINQLFYQYNWTVTESTPLDVEVAVDPEMLGKVFEELVTGRHESGSYYTPKPIVSFMCREALKGYLRSALPHEVEATIAAFVDTHDATDLRNPEQVLAALRRITVCDPACGSGAYLLGMLHELLDLRASLFAAKQVDSPSVYERKLEIIRQNIYGVDLDPFAINIAQLRLWLSLVVDYQLGREGEQPPLLPNLEYKIAAGDSLAAPSPQGLGQQAMRDQLVTEFNEVKDQFIAAHGEEKYRLKAAGAALRHEIWSVTPQRVDESMFDWVIDYAEVFHNGGFDVMVANPPYVRMELFKDIKPMLKRNFAQVHADRADLYIYFYARALDLLRPGGMLAFISPNKWFRANYGAKLREHIATLCAVSSITDFGDLPVFESATTYPMIFIAQKGEYDSPITFTQVQSLNEPYPDVLAMQRSQGHVLPADAIQGSDWMLADNSSAIFLRTMDHSSVTLGHYTNGKIYRGIVTGSNDAFVINGAQRAALIAADSRSNEIIKPLAVGNDVRRWNVRDTDKWLIYTYHGVNPKHYPAIIEHLQPFQNQLENRATKQKWFELQQPQAVAASFFSKPKIVYPEITNESRFALDRHGYYTNNKVFTIALEDPYLLGILNSSSLWKYITNISSTLRGGFYELRLVYIKNLPVPTASEADRKFIGDLVEQCLEAKGTGPQVTEWEAAINERVAWMYGLKDTPE